MAELHSSFISRIFLRSHGDIEDRAWQAITQQKTGMNAAIHELHGLTQDEIRMIGRGMGERG